MAVETVDAHGGVLVAADAEVGLGLRDDASETFLDAYRRLGAEPFKAALYPAEAARDAA